MNQVMDLIRSLTTFIPSLLIVIFVLSSVVYLEPLFMLFVFSIVISFYFSIIFIFKAKAAQLGNSRKKYFNDSIGSIRSILSNIKEIKIENNKTYFLNKFRSVNSRYRHSIASTKILQESPKFVVEPLLILIAILLVSFYLIR